MAGGFTADAAKAEKIMESEQLQNFNERLSQWVANQGFWFQLRYSMAGSGMRGRAMFHLLKMGFRLLIFLVVVALGVTVYLMKRTESPRFQAAFQEDLKEAFSASELEMREFNHLQGQMEINRLAAEGGSDTFFTTMEARNIRCKMNLVDGIVGVWKPGIISVSRLDMELRAGTDDAESARKLSEAVFRRSPKVDVNSFEIADATFRWGFSERTQGSIESSDLKAQRNDNGWRLSFKGGTFSQNWLKGLKIISLVVVCEPDGLYFEKAELQEGAGTVDFSGLRLKAGERPELNGVVRIRNLNIEEILPPALRTFVEGSFSGDFKVFGSTNTSDGVGFEGQVLMDGKDVISLRERIHILKALSVVDFSRNYHRVDFREGSFMLKTHRGGLQLSEIKLKAEDLFTMEGAIGVRLPTDKEVQDAVAQGTAYDNSPIFAAEDEEAERASARKTESDFSLKRAALEAKRVQEGQQSLDSMTLFDRLGLTLEMRRLQAQASERISRMLRYEGGVVITIPGDAFERATRLQALYPADRSTGRVPMRVPIEGNLYDLTLKQAEDIYQQGQR